MNGKERGQGKRGAVKSRAAEIAKELAAIYAAEGNVVAEVKDADAKFGFKPSAMRLSQKSRGRFF